MKSATPILVLFQMATKRLGEPLENPHPAKATAGERADAHAEVQQTMGRATDEPMTEERHRKGKDNLESAFEGRPKPPETNVLRTFAANLVGPTPCHEDVYLTIQMDILDEFAKVLRNQILNVLFPDGDYRSGGVCSEEDWVRVVQCILKSRIDHVYSKHSGRRPNDRIPLMRIAMPRSLAMLINGIGLKPVFHQNFFVCPAPPPPPEDRSAWVIAQGTHTRVQAFSNLVNAASQRGVIFTSEISSLPDGTGWWLLRASPTENITLLAGIETRSITIWAQFPDWTPADGVLAAMAVTGQTGFFIDDWHQVIYKLDSMTDVVAMRAVYCTQG